MNVIDKLYTEWAWRTKTGIPDINNIEDKVILDHLIKELTDADGEISKKEVINAINQGDYTPEQLRSILNGISAITYKQDVFNYLDGQGKAVANIKKYIYNELVENGDIQNYHSMIGKFPTYSSLGKSGNLYAPFKGKISGETLKYLMNKKPSGGNIATGKGEIYLATLISDVTSDSPHGDVAAGGIGIEVKNTGARPAGQKFKFAKNTDKAIIDFIVSRVNKILPEPFEPPAKYGARPFHRILIILAAALKQDQNITDRILQIGDDAISNYYGDLDLTDVKLTKYKKGNSFDADAFEKEFIKRVIRAYAKAEGFEEIVFLNDDTGSFIKVPSASLEGLVGTKIKATMKDGLPEWSYNF